MIALEGMPMVRRWEQARTYSEAEFARRRALVRGLMAERGAEALLILMPASEAYDAWLLGEHNLDGVAVSADGAVLGLTAQAYPPKARELFHGAFFAPPQDTAFTDDPDALMRRLSGAKRIGLINPGAMTHAVAQQLERVAPGATLVDMTLEVAIRKNVKSAEEKAAIAAAGRVHERVMLAMPQVLRQGRSVRDVSNDITAMMCQMGSGDALIHAFLINYGPSDAPAYPLRMNPWPGEIFRARDRAMVLLETNGPGGHCTAIGRFFCLGEPDPGFSEVIDMTIRTQRYATSLLKPGATLREVARQTQRFVEGNGWETAADQCFMHGLGANLYEQFAVGDISQDTPLLTDCFMHAHPVVKRHFPRLGPDALDHQFILDAFLVSEEGGVRTNNVPQKLFIVE